MDYNVFYNMDAIFNQIKHINMVNKRYVKYDTYGYNIKK